MYVYIIEITNKIILDTYLMRHLLKIQLRKWNIFGIPNSDGIHAAWQNAVDWFPGAPKEMVVIRGSIQLSDDSCVH